MRERYLFLLAIALLVGAMFAETAQAARSRPQGIQLIQFGQPVQLSAADGHARRVSLAANPNTTPNNREATVVWDRKPTETAPGYAFESSSYSAISNSWSPLINISTNDNAPNGDFDNNLDTSETAMDSSGNAYTLVVEYDQTLGHYVANRYIRSAGSQDWQFGARVSDQACNAASPSLDLNTSGSLGVAAWVCGQGSDRKIQYARLSNSGWTPAQDISTICKEVTSVKEPLPVVATNINGDSIIAWACSSDGTGSSLAIKSRIYTSTLGLMPVTTISQAGEMAAKPEVGITSSCRTAIAYNEGPGNTTRVMFRERRPLSCGDSVTAWKGALLLSAGFDADWPDLDINSNGDIGITWNEHETDGAPSRAKLRYRASTEGNFRQTQTLTNGDDTVENDSSCSGTRIALEQSPAAGDALLTWYCADVLPAAVPTCAVSDRTGLPYCWRVQGAVYRRSSGALTVSGFLSAENQMAGMNATGGMPKVAVDEAGNGVIAYARRTALDEASPQIAEAVSVIGF